LLESSARTPLDVRTGTGEGVDDGGAGGGAGVADGSDAALGTAGLTWANLALATDSATVSTRVAAASSAFAAVIFAGAVMCAAYYAANNATNDKDDDDDDRCHPPSRAVPRPFRGPGTILQLPFLVGEGSGAGAVALCEWLLVCKLAIWSWGGGRAAIAAFV
jgi:hypothetical protein